MATITATERPQQVSKPRAGILQQLWNGRIAYLYIIPAAAVMLVITVIPFSTRPIFRSPTSASRT